MEIDHFNPHRKKDKVQHYDNLMLASRHCNNSKGDFWPTPEDFLAERRLLNPCEELDYGVHIFEIVEKGELISETVPGITHVRILDLNAPHFKDGRLERTQLRDRFLRFQQRARLSGEEPNQEAQQLHAKIENVLALHIPPVVPPPFAAF